MKPEIYLLIIIAASILPNIVFIIINKRKDYEIEVRLKREFNSHIGRCWCGSFAFYKGSKMYFNNPPKYERLYVCNNKHTTHIEE